MSDTESDGYKHVCPISDGVGGGFSTLSMTTSPAAPICPVATISGERPAALVSPATDLIGEGVSHSRGEVDSL